MPGPRGRDSSGAGAAEEPPPPLWGRQGRQGSRRRRRGACPLVARDRPAHPHPWDAAGRARRGEADTKAAPGRGREETRRAAREDGRHRASGRGVSGRLAEDRRR